MKICILGGGGSRALILAKSLLLNSEQLKLKEIVLMDINEETLGIFGGLIVKAASLINENVKLSYNTDAITAITNSDYVITTIRVGGDESRVNNERIAISHGTIGQETTGAGGFAMALEAIPVIADYCRLIKRYAKKNVIVFNFSNPAGLVTQAMRDLGYDFVYGICDAPSGFLRQIAKYREKPFEVFHMDVFGLNHLSFFTKITEENKDILNEIINDPCLYQQTDMRYFDQELSQKWGILFNEYLFYYFYREKAASNILKSQVTRGEVIKLINHMMIQDLKSYNPEKDFEKMLEIFSKYNHQRELSYMSIESSRDRSESSASKFDLYNNNDYGYAGIVISFLKSIISGRYSEMVLCVPNNGTVNWLEQDDVIESTCSIDGLEVKPKSGMKELPETAKVLIQTVKKYERLASHSILQKDRDLAIEALMIHPLVNSYSLAKDLVNHYLVVKNKKTTDGGWNE